MRFVPSSLVTGNHVDLLLSSFANGPQVSILITELAYIG